MIKLTFVKLFKNTIVGKCHFYFSQLLVQYKAHLFLDVVLLYLTLAFVCKCMMCVYMHEHICVCEGEHVCQPSSSTSFETGSLIHSCDAMGAID